MMNVEGVSVCRQLFEDSKQKADRVLEGFSELEVTPPESLQLFDLIG